MTWQTPATLLENETRRALFDRVRAEPGLTVTALASELGVHYKTALYHARLLERAGRLVLARDGGRSACYLCGVPAPRRIAPWALATMTALREGVVSTLAVAQAIGVPRTTAHMMLRRLEARGLARHVDNGWTLAPGVGGFIGPDEGFSQEPT